MEGMVFLYIEVDEMDASVLLYTRCFLLANNGFYVNFKVIRLIKFELRLVYIEYLF